MTLPAALPNQLIAIEWLEPWATLVPERAAHCEQRLKRQLTPEHPLNGRSVHAVAARIDEDEVLYWADEPEAFFVVRLTTKKPARFDAASCIRFDSLAAFAEGCMTPDHLEYSESDADD